MAVNAPNVPRPAELLSGLLDAGYTNAAGPVIRALARDTQQGVLATRLQQLESRARELAEQGQSLSADDPVLRALLADFGTTLRSQATLINAVSGDLTQTGIDAAGQFVRQTTLPGLSDNDLTVIGLRWNTPDPAAVNAAVNYTASAGWRDELAAYENDLVQQIRDIALRGMVSGRGPIAIANDLRAAVEGIPAFRANTLMRTLQLQSYRVGTAAHQAANSDILDYQIRIAALDNRTCLTCISEHGTRMPIGALVLDHHSGRCTSIAVVKGRPRDIRTGEEWFNSLPEERQRLIAGPGAFDALKRGDVRLQDFVQPYQDKVFGDMIRQGSLKWAMSRPERRVMTANGEMEADKGAPGDSPASLNTFMQQSRGPLATALRDPEAGLLELDWDTDQYSIRKDGVQSAAKRFVAESLDIQYGKDYLLSVMRENAAARGVTLSDSQLERLYNQEYGTKARAIMTAARIGRVRLTEAQLRRLETAVDGEYLNMVYSREGSESGSLVNAVERRQRSRGVMTDAERDERRRNFLDMLGRLK